MLALAGYFASFNGTSTLHAQTTNIWNFNFSGSIVRWTVPQTTMYSITAYGAEGGTGATQSYAGCSSSALVGIETAAANYFSVKK
ncbi:MAG: hypothetical protein ACKPB4_16435 [Sphaerospermopsis kisseleviana]